MAVDIAFKANVDLGDGAKSLISLKKEFKETQKELDGLTTGTQKYVDTLKRLGKIKDEIGDLRQEIEAFHPEGKVKAFGDVIGGVASGFQAATGAAALFGGENKDLEKTLVKLQAVMAFTEGIKGLVSLGDGFKVLGNIVKANPIFLVVGIILAIGTAMYELKDKIGFIGKAFEVLGDIIGKIVQAGKDFLDFAGATSFASTKLADSIIANSKKIKESVESRYDSEISAAKRAGKATELLEIEKLGAVQKANDATIKQLNLRRQANKTLSEEDQKLLDESVKENAKANIQILDLYDKYNDDFADKKKKENEKYKADLDKKRAEHQKYLDANADAENKEADAYDARKKKQKEDERKVEIDGFKQGQLDAIQMLADYNSDLMAQSELKALQNKNDLKAQLEFLEAQKQAELRTKEFTTNEKLVIDEKYRQKAKALEQSDFDNRIKTASNVNSSLTSLSNLFFDVKNANLKKGSAEELKSAKQQFNINKALSLSAAVVSGIQAVQNSLAVSPLTILGVPNPASIVALIATGVTAAANVAKIAASRFQESGTASIPTVNAPSSGSAPSINPPSSTNTQLNNDGTIKNTTTPQQPPIRSYVVETDITNSQKRVKDIQLSGLH